MAFLASGPVLGLASSSVFGGLASSPALGMDDWMGDCFELQVLGTRRKYLFGMVTFCVSGVWSACRG